ncbi:DUF7282 domain-containing protein [Natronorubrum sp. DTA7]|uniref:DUF7282 domain-containing protein n=1 Tax=Natronorubrum sp. DTA7 TaxID=3447016 RepID=UPI003F869831
MNTGRAAVAATLFVAFLMVTSVMALPLLGATVAPFAGSQDGAGDSNGDTAEIDTGDETAANGASDVEDADSSESLELVAMEPTTAAAETTDADAADAVPESDAAEGTAATSADLQTALAQEQVDAVETGVDEGIELAQSQGVNVTQEQRAAAIEGASESVTQHQEADVEQVQEATKGAVHGSLMQSQQVEVEQIQSAVGGATDGALAQYQTVEASQMQAATWGATHGALAQEQRVEVEQIQVAAQGAAAGAAFEAGAQEINETPKIQEAAQGAAYGALAQYQQITVEQRQQVTLEHVQHAAAGASAGALEGATQEALEQTQDVEVEQYQRVDIKQIQKAATGGAKGALVQQQEVTVEQTQSAARGASAGALKQVQTVTVEQVQRISITQIQEASFGAAKGSIAQSQEASVEQIQTAAEGAAGGVLVQQQEISITQIQYAAVGAAEGAIEGALQQQVVEVEQIQAAAFGAGEGAVIQTQVVDVTQVQILASGSASGVLMQHQEATVQQIQFAASAACQQTAQLIQYQQISITQLQILIQETASDATAYAVQEGIDDPTEISQYVEIEIEQRIEAVDELEGEASIAFADQDSDGESVTVDSVELSEGGFVAIYAGDAADPNGVIGVSSYLESGEHTDVEIALEEPIEGDQPLVAVAHHDTTDDESFQYAASDGEEDEPYVTEAGAPVLDTALVTVDAPDDPGEPDDPVDPEATLAVSDQEGDGETLVVDEASADTEFTVAAAYDGEQVESDQFAANETQTDLELALEPPIEESTTVDVSVVGDDDAELATESIEYTLADEPPAPEPEATLNVSDQTGDGETLTVEEASADVDYQLTVTDEDGEQRAASETFEGNETVELESLNLEPPLEENATLDVAVESVGDATDAGGETETPGDDTDADADGVLASETIEYTVDGGEAFEATFVDCTEAEVTGSFEDGDMIIVTTGFYESGGFGNTMGEYAITVGDDVEAPFEGTITYETGEEFAVEETADGATVTVPEGNFGTAITGFSSPDAIPGSIDHPNPDASECIEEVRPDLPDLTVEETEPTDDGIDVTFGYENPNDAELLVGSEFLEGTTEDEPVDALEPGANEFTVQWTPETDDERLVWAVDMSNYDYEADAVEPAATETAGEIDPTEDAEFSVAITGTNEPVEQGETLEVGAELENVGEAEDSQEIELALDGETVDTAEVSLEPGAVEETTLTAETDDLEPGEYTAAVSSENETAETVVTIEAADADELEGEATDETDEPAETETDEPVDEGAADDPVEEAPADAPADEGTTDGPGDDETPTEEPPTDADETPGDEPQIEEPPTDADETPADEPQTEEPPTDADETDGSGDEPDEDIPETNDDGGDEPADSQPPEDSETPEVPEGPAPDSGVEPAAAAA